MGADEGKGGFNLDNNTIQIIKLLMEIIFFDKFNLKYGCCILRKYASTKPFYSYMYFKKEKLIAPRIDFIQTSLDHIYQTNLLKELGFILFFLFFFFQITNPQH